MTILITIPWPTKGRPGKQFERLDKYIHSMQDVVVDCAPCGMAIGCYSREGLCKSTPFSCQILKGGSKNHEMEFVCTVLAIWKEGEDKGL